MNGKTLLIEESPQDGFLQIRVKLVLAVLSLCITMLSSCLQKA